VRTKKFVSSSLDARLDLSVQEPMAVDTTLQKQIRRIGEIIERLESTADPNARAMARELLESLMALHGAALQRILEIASEAGESGETAIRKFARDELVSSLLLLYGLHPEDLNTRVARALENTRSYLASHSASAGLVSIGGCGSSTASVKTYLEAAIQDAVPDATSIVVEDAVALLAQSGFVSLAQLESGQSMASLSAARAQRGGD
jgi:hypothetical protein